MKALNKLLTRRNIFKPITFAIIAVFVMLVILVSMQTTYFTPETERLESYMNHLTNEINAKGVEPFVNELKEGAFISDSRIPANANMIVLDRDNNILAATSDKYITAQDKLYLMIARYGSNRMDWKYSADGRSDGWDTASWLDTRLALITDEGGTILGTLRAILSNDTYNVGASLPKYAEYFPALDESYYQDAVVYTENSADQWERGWSLATYDWSNIEPLPEQAPIAPPAMDPQMSSYQQPEVAIDHWYDSDPYTPPQNTTMANKVRDYVQWENAQISSAGNMRLVYRGPAWDGTQLVLIYPDTDAMHMSQFNEQKAWRRINAIQGLMTFMVLLFFLSLASWVYVDAKGRDYRPALWGIFTLFGNVIAWIVYMLVRPGGDSAKGCPACHAPTKRNYAFCANCGAQLCETCHRCGHHLEPSFHFCPNCGCGINEKAAEPALIIEPDQTEPTATASQS